MTEVSDDITLGELVARSARALAHAGLEHRIDIYRDVDVDDPAVSRMLGQPHTVRVRIKITAASLLFDEWEKALPATNEPLFHERQA